MLNPSDNEGWTPLHYAAQEGHASVCEAILKNVSDKNPSDNRGRTPLHEAAMDGRIQAIKAILNQVSNKNPVDNDGRTPKEIFLFFNDNLENDIDWE